MNDFLVRLQETGLATFIHESDSLFAFPFVLTVHTIGLCLIVGANTLVSLRLLGVASTIPLRPLRRLFPFMWIGLILTILSGTALAIAAATTRVLNPIVLFKVALILVAAPMMRSMQKKYFGPNAPTGTAIPEGARALASSQLFLWLIILTAGRLIAYSATIFGEGF